MFIFKKWLFVSGLFVLVSVTSVHAIGALFNRPLWSDREYDKMWIKRVDATADIEGQIAVTHVDQIFHNDMDQQVEAIWVFPLPEGAVVTELFYWFNGVQYQGSIKEREEARRKYEEKVRRLIDPALLEYLGDNLYRLSIAPINADSDVRFEITYVRMLEYEFGTVEYEFKMNAVELSPKALERISFQGNFQAPRPYKSFAVPSHVGTTALSVTEISDKARQVVYGDEHFTPEKDLLVQFETIRDHVDINVIRYTPTEDDSIGDDSYYAVWITPPDEISGEDVIPKKIVFVADVSSSMEGVRIEQLRASLDAFLQHLQPDDQFNIITFGTSVASFKPDLVPASAEHLQAASDFVYDLVALGLTNINDALMTALSQSFDENYANMIVFLTDGKPTWGETFVPTIVENVSEANEHDVRIFSFGVGEDVSKALLSQISVQNGGYVTYIDENDNISNKVENHFIRISKPVLTDLEIRIQGLKTTDTYPRPIPDLFWGNQVMQLGLYHESGTFPVYLIGSVRDRQMSYTDQKDFPTEPGGHQFVPRLWAKQKIDYLLEQIDIYGEKDELVNQIIELSLRFQILTPYTAYYADPDESSTDIEKEPSLPVDFQLYQNVPNPFNPSTTIRYRLPSAGQVTIRIYDITGRLVRILIESMQTAGVHSVVWDGINHQGSKVAAGVYLYQIEFRNADGHMQQMTKKMSLVR